MKNLNKIVCAVLFLGYGFVAVGSDDLKKYQTIMDQTWKKVDTDAKNQAWCSKMIKEGEESFYKMLDVLECFMRVGVLLTKEGMRSRL